MIGGRVKECERGVGVWEGVKCVGGVDVSVGGEVCGKE